MSAWLVVCFAGCYTLPLTALAKTAAKSCCNSHGSCCRKHAAGHANTGGSFWAATEQCTQGCRMPASLLAHAWPLAAPTAVGARSAEPFGKLHARPAARSGLASAFAFLYQRPPPSRS